LRRAAIAQFTSFALERFVTRSRPPSGVRSIRILVGLF